MPGLVILLNGKPLPRTRWNADLDVEFRTHNVEVKTRNKNWLAYGIRIDRASPWYEVAVPRLE
jgi:hypothetical protein